MNSQNSNLKPKVSIGLPVYNGEKSIRNTLDSILSQTFKNFKLIISDNGSTDSTYIICQEYVLRDKRIEYIRQNKNMGVNWNFNFVLKQSNSEYFIWVASDDTWHSEFLQKNIYVLDNNKDVVGSIGDIIYSNTVNYKFELDTNIKIDLKKFRYVQPTYGTYENKVRSCLKICQGSMIYGLFRREQLQKNTTINEFFATSDLSIILNVLKYGNLHVIDQKLLHRYDKGSHSVIENMHKYNVSLIKIIFLELPFTVWCLKNLGFKIFIKNFDLFMKINLRGEYSVIAELVRMCKRIVYGQEKYW